MLVADMDSVTPPPPPYIEPTHEPTDSVLLTQQALVFAQYLCVDIPAVICT